MSLFLPFKQNRFKEQSRLFCLRLVLQYKTANTTEMFTLDTKKRVTSKYTSYAINARVC